MGGGHQEREHQAGVNACGHRGAFRAYAAAWGRHHPALRRPPGRLLPAARRHERRRLGPDRVRRRSPPTRPTATRLKADRRGARELRLRDRRALHPARASAPSPRSSTAPSASPPGLRRARPPEDGPGREMRFDHLRCDVMRARRRPPHGDEPCVPCRSSSSPSCSSACASRAAAASRPDRCSPTTCSRAPHRAGPHRRRVHGERRDAPLPGGRHRRPDPPQGAAGRAGRRALAAAPSSSSSTTRPAPRPPPRRSTPAPATACRWCS